MALPSGLVRRVAAAFQTDLATPPPMTLRGGNAVDSYDLPPPPDPVLDAVDDAYLAAHTFWGMAHLDSASWRHYLPALIDYADRHPDDPYMVVEGLLHNLRPPDREPPRLGSLNAEQVAVVAEVLCALAADPGAAHRDNRDFAAQVHAEWWSPDAQRQRG